MDKREDLLLRLNTIAQNNESLYKSLEDVSVRFNRMAAAAEQADTVIDDIQEQFLSATKLKTIDVGFLFTAVALQVVRQYLLTPMTKRMGNQESGDKVKDTKPVKWLGMNEEHSNRRHRYYNPSLEEIITNPVPYDANCGADTEEAGDVADYMIFMQDPARIAEYPDSGVIYEDEYGCKIIKHKNMIALICTKIKGDDVREKLSEYYNYLRETYHMGTGKSDAAADNVMKNRKNINESAFLNGYWEWMSKLVDKIDDTIENMEEGLGDLADSMDDDLSDDNPFKVARGILKIPAVLGGVAGGIAAGVAMYAGTFLAGVPSLLPGMASDAQMDDKVIPVAQRRILAIKAYEWIQMKAMVENA